MRNVFLSTLITLFSALVLLVSCAKEVEISNESYELKSLREWVKINHPDMEEVQEGLFAKIHKFDPTLPIQPLQSTDWVEVTYCSQLTDGNYYYNMYPDIANRLSTFSYFTHYVPARMSAYNLTYNLSLAQSLMLQKMNILDSVEIICTSKYSYGGNLASTAPLGFQGNTTQPISNPSIIRMKYNRVIRDMYKYQRDEVRQYAYTNMGLPSTDTVPKISMMFFKVLDANPKGDTISKDTTVEVTYTGMFTDGFVFDTNDAEVAKDNNIYIAASADTKYTSLSVTYNSGDSNSDATGSTIAGFKECVRLMRVGETAQVVFTSNLGYGVAGSTQGNTLIRPNTPLVFIIKVIPPEKKDEEETVK